MRFDILTLFPEVIDCVLGSSIIGRAKQNGIIEVYSHNIRDYTKDKHKKTDDAPFGGGKGMLMSTQPIADCFDAVKSQINGKTKVIYASPRGRIFNHEVAKELSEYDNVIILCGHYEGVDQRIIDTIIDEEISIGDYVLTGGELPAMVIADSVCRYVDGVISHSSLVDESFSENLLEYPQYTRPQVYKGLAVPDVLRSGDHAKVDAWRREQSIAITKKYRPDLLNED